jgi:ELWxxDGT repeat protein
LEDRVNPSPLRLDYSVSPAGPIFNYEFTLTLDNHDGTYLPGQGWDWLVYGDVPSGLSPINDFVATSPSPYFNWYYGRTSGNHNGPSWTPFHPGRYWIPSNIGDSLSWKGDSATYVPAGSLKFSTLNTYNGAVAVNFEVANLATLSATLDGNGNLAVSDDSLLGIDNSLSITRNGSNLVLSNQVEPFVILPSGWTRSTDGKSISTPISSFPGSITVNGNGGNDTLTVDLSGGPIPNAITFNGGSPTSDSGDRLILTGEGTYSTVTHRPTGISDGLVFINNGTGTITYTALETITDNLIADNRVFQFTNGTESITLSDSGGADGRMTIGSTLSGFVEFVNPTWTLIVETAQGSGADVVMITSLDPAFSGSLEVIGNVDDLAILNAAYNPIPGNVLLINTGTITVEAAQTTSGFGAIRLIAASDIAVNAPLTSGGGEVLLTADSDGDGNGRLTLAPQVLDSWVARQQLAASNSAAGDQFGGSVAINGDGSTAVVSANLFDNGGNVDQGTAYVFVRTGAVWTQQAQLLASDGVAHDLFGRSVAISADGNTIVVGAGDADVGGNINQGAAYVFTRSGTTWTQQAKLTASGGAIGDTFGNGLALSADGNTALVGARFTTVNGHELQGSAYVFVRSGTTWTQQAQLNPADGAAGDQVNSVALSADGNTAIVGSYLHDGGGNVDQGGAFVYTRSGLTWTQQAELVAADGAANDRLGISVSLSADGNVAAVTAYQHRVNGVQQGAAYVFTRAGTGWTQQAELVAADGSANDQFGVSISISSDGATIVVGSQSDDVGANVDQGSAYVYSRAGTTWTQQAHISFSGGMPSDFFGNAVGLSGDGKSVIIGAIFSDVGGHTDQGAAHIYTFVPGTAGGSIAAGVGSVSISAADADIQNTITAAGTISVTPSKVGQPVTLGADTPGTLGLTDAELDRITTSSPLLGATTTLVIGNASTGPIRVVATIDRSAPTYISLVSGSDIVLSGGRIDTNGPFHGKVRFSPGPLGSVWPTNSGVDVISTYTVFDRGTSLRIDISGPQPDSQYTQYNVSGIAELFGMDLVLTGSYVPVLGDSFAIISGAPSWDTLNGLANAGTINFNGKVLTAEYVGGRVNLNAVSLAPNAVPNGPFQISTGQNLSLNASGSTDPDPWDSLTYAWDLNNDGLYDVTSTSPTVVVPWDTLSTYVGSSGTYPVRLRVTDTYGLNSVATTSLTVNSPPTVSVDHSSVTVPEGSPATNSGTFDDADGRGTVTLMASVGTITQNNAAGTWSWSLPTQDNTAGPVAVTVTATDSQGAVATATFTYTVTNTPPVLATQWQQAGGLEGFPITNLITVTDVPADSATLSASLGQLEDLGNGTWRWRLVSPDNFPPTDVTITATDDDGGVSTTTFNVNIANADPTATITGAPSTSPQYAVVSLGSTVTDSGADTFTYAWAVTRNGTLFASGSKSTIAFTPIDAGTYAVQLTVTDDDGGVGTATSMIAVTTAPSPIPLGPLEVAKVGNTYFVRAYDAVHGYELWATDGTPAGTRLVRDINPGPGGSDSQGFLAFGSKLLFSAGDPEHGFELWASDGTAAGTILLSDAYPGPDSSSAGLLSLVNGRVYFTAYEPDTGYRLWKTDGTPSGTTPAGITPFPEDGEIRLIGSTLYYFGEDPTYGRQLWRSDGTPAGTSRVTTNLPQGPSATYLMKSAGTNLFIPFGDFGSSEWQLWMCDGTGDGVHLATYIQAGSGFAASNPPDDFTVVGSKTFFTAGDPEHGRELWSTDGTSAGTTLVADLYPGPTSSVSFGLVSKGTRVYFAANTPATGVEFFSTDGTAAGTVQFLDLAPGSASVLDPYSPLQLIENAFVFAVPNATNGYDLWQTDGTITAPFILQGPGPIGARPYIAYADSGRILYSSYTQGNDRPLQFMTVPPVVSVSGSAGLETDDANTSFSWSSTSGFQLTDVQVSVTQNSVEVFASADTSGTVDLNEYGLGTFEITVTATNLAGESTVATRTVTVTDDDTDPPAITLGGSVGTESHGLTQAFTWAAADPTGLGPVMVTVTRDGETIYSSTSGTGAFNFDAYGLGTYTVTVTAADADADWAGDAAAATASRTVVVTNAAPTADDGSVVTAEDTAVAGHVTGGDPDGDPVTFAVLNGPAFGAVSFHADGTFTYTPGPNFNGSDHFAFVASDGSLTGVTGTVAVTVTPVNDPPTANPASFSGFEDTAVSGQLTGCDPDGDALIYSLVTVPVHGSAAVHPDGTFTYTPAAGYAGTDAFTFRVWDGSAYSPAATVSLGIAAVNHIPTATGRSVTTAEDTAHVGAVSASDPDGDPLTYAVFNAPAHGQLSLAANGGFTYTPGPNFHGTDSFTFVADDGHGSSAPATVTITVTAVNDAPLAFGDSLELPDSGDGDVVLLGTDVETATQDLVFTVVTVPSRGVLLDGTGRVVRAGDTFTGNPAVLTYRLVFAFGQVTDAFTYRVRDTGDPTGTAGNALDSTPATVSLSLPVGSAGVMRVGGMDAADNLQLDVVGGNVRIRDNGATAIAGVPLPSNIPLTSVNQVRVFARGGDDTVGWTGVTKPVSVDGGSGTDLLTVNGTNGADTFDLNASDVAVNGTTITRSGVEQLSLLGLAGNNQLNLHTATPDASFVFSGTGSSDAAAGPNADLTWTVSGPNTIDVTVGGVTIGQLQAVENLTGGTGNDTYALLNALSGSITDLGGTDTLTYLGLAGPSAAVNLQARTATNVGGTIPTGIEVVEGNGFGMPSSLTGFNGATTWAITSPNGGTVGGVTFRQFTDLVGGNGTDQFAFAPGGTIAGTVNGGGGSDTIAGDGSANEFVLTGSAVGTFTGRAGGFMSVETVAGNGGYDTLRFTAASPVTVNLATSTAAGGVTESFTGIERFVGTAGSDTLTLASVATPSTWTVTGIAAGALVNDPAGPAPLAVDFDGFENLASGSGADTFTVAAGGYLGAGQIDSGGGTDTLVGPDADTTWSITGANNAGSLTDIGTGKQRATFANVESLTGGIGKDAFVFGAGRSVTGAVSGGGGVDTLDFSTYATAVSVNLAAQSSTGIFGGAANGFSGIETLKGGTASDTLTGPNAATSWAISGSNAGSVAGYSFTGFENLTGGTGDDTFTLANAATVAGQIVGGTGSDRLDFSAFTTPVSVNLANNAATGLFGGATNGFSGIESFTGGTATDTLTGPNSANTWALTSRTLNGTIQFNGFEVLTGGTGADTFLASASDAYGGTLDGGGGTADKLAISDGDGNGWFITGPNAGSLNAYAFRNIENLTGGIGFDDFNFSAGGSIAGKLDGGSSGGVRFASSVTVNLQTGSVPGVIGSFANVGWFQGNGSADAMIGPNANSTWNFYDAFGNSAVNGVGILGFETLTGGSGNDTYVFGNGGKVTGVVDGGTGTNTLDYSAYSTPIVVNLALAAPTATGTLGVTNVQNVTGGAGDDLIVGNSGKNVLTGNAGRDVLIGGGGGDTVSGGAGDDIVIAGTTSYDTTPAALQAIRDYWSRTDLTYAQRIAGLTTGIPSPAGTVRLTATTVQNDNVADTLSGGSELDWFFARTTGSNSSRDTITDKDSSETLTSI